MASFDHTLNYSAANEDGASELRALSISKADTVLCITGSGARPLDLLLACPASLVAIDVNPCQTFLLELKRAAIAALEYEEVLAFLGVVPSSARKQTYARLRSRLSAPARVYWDQRAGAVARGVIYEGRWERYFRRLARLVRLQRPQALAALFAARTVEEQADVWREIWDTGLWRAFLHVICSRVAWRFGLGDPGFYHHRRPDTAVYFQERFAAAAKRFLFRESPFAVLLFHGRFLPDSPLPHHLHPEAHTVLRNHLQRLELVTAPLETWLERADRRFNRFSLSDVASYTSQEEYDRVWRGVLNTAAGDATVCERQFLVKREPAPKLASRISRDHLLEQALEQSDTSIFYSFVVGTIHPKRSRDEIHRR